MSNVKKDDSKPNFSLQARAMDGPSRQGFVESIEGLFQSCIQLYPKEPLTVLAMAVAVQSAFTFFDDEQPSVRLGSTMALSSPKAPVAGLSRKASERKPFELINVMALERCKRLYARCRRLDAVGYYPAYAANKKVFRDVFQAKRTILVERNKTLKLPDQLKEDKKGRVSPEGACVSPKAETRATVVVSQINSRMIVSIFERTNDNEAGRQYLPEIILHEDEVSCLIVCSFSPKAYAMLTLIFLCIR